MVSFVALGVCLLFVGALLKIDRQLSTGLSKALWIPTLWFLYCATRPLDEWFQRGQFGEAGTTTIESGSVLDRNFLSILIVISLVILQKRGIKWSEVFRANRWLVALLAYMLVSIVWSDYQFVSLKRWVRVAGTFIMALMVLTEVQPYEAMQAILRRLIYVVIPFSALLVKYFPRLGVSFGRWSGAPSYCGATLTRNNLGEICMLAVFFIVWDFVRRRDGNELSRTKHRILVEIVLLVLTAYLMKGPSGYGADGATYSATSLVVLVVGLATFFALRRLKTYIAYLGRLICLTLLAIGLVVLLLNLLDTSLVEIVAMSVGRKPDLTGRTDLIWDVLLPIAWQHPIFGAGFGSFWIAPVPGLTLDVNEAHNGYLDVFMELGVVGLVFVFCLFANYFQRAKQEFQDSFHWAAFRLSFLLIILLHNWSETTLLRSREILWNLLVLFLVVFPGNWVWRPVPAPEKAPPGNEYEKSEDYVFEK
jgi:O-antigen ligase